MIKKQIHFLALLSLAVFISCSSDDSPEKVNPFVGSWSLIEINLTEARDINGDDISSINLLDELDCLFASITIEANSTWISTGTSFEVGAEGIQNLCTEEGETTGNWTQSDETTIIISNGTFNLIEDRLVSEREGDILGIQSVVYLKD